MAVGFDEVLHPNALNLSLIVGLVGFVVSVWLHWSALRSGNPSAEAPSVESRRRKLSGKSIAGAYLALEEIESAQIR